MTTISTARNLVDLFFTRAGESGERTALLVKRGGEFRPVSWWELAQEVRRAASVLQSSGVRTGDRVIQLSENRYEWIIADLAIMTCGAVHVPVHAPLAAEQVAYQIANSGAKVVIVSTREQAEKLAAAADLLPAECRYFSHDELENFGGALAILPFATAAGDEEAVEAEVRESLTLDALATILYTSGTTGQPKGVMLTHGNLLSNAISTLAMFDQTADDRRLCFLPLSHIFARTCDEYTWIATGSTLALAESRETVVADAQAVKPTHLSGVPYFYDKVYRGLSAANMSESPGIVKQLFGGEVRMLASGGAALPGHLFDFFLAQGLPVLQGYGLSESSPVITVTPPGEARRGSSGRAIPDVEVRIAEDGEILTRGPHVMRGYWQDEEATREVIDENDWLHTGDLGHLDEDGFLFITGRKKEIIVTAAGKNISPTNLEALLTADPLVLQAMVLGDDRSYLTALIVPNSEALRGEIAARNIAVESREEALTHPEVRQLYAERIAERFRTVSHHEQIRQFTLLSRGFTIESGELTPKASLRRKVIEANFADVIEAMYRQPCES